MVVTEWRLPRVAMAMLVGAALGVSGAIFQSLMRNPLGSPDVMGLNTGAGAACWSRWCCLVSIDGHHRDGDDRRDTDRAGDLAACRRNGIDTFRLIIIGIGVRAMLMAFNTAAAAGFAGNGAVGRAVVCRFPQRPDRGKVWPAAPLILLMFIAALLLVRRMRLLDMVTTAPVRWGRR